MTTEILIGDCRESLKSLPECSVHCCVTSPPYYGLRDYGTAKWSGGDPDCGHKDSDALAERMRQKKSMIACGERMDGSTRTRVHDESIGKTVQYRDVCKKCGAVRVDKQIGLEKTPDEYVQKMVEVFREVRRILRDDGTCWVNLGTSYAGSGGARKEHHRNPVISKSFERDGYSGGKPANQSPQQQHVPACDSDGKESQGCQDHGCACHGQCDEHPAGTQTRHGRTAHNDQCAEQGSRPSLQTGRDTGHSGSEQVPLSAFPCGDQESTTQQFSSQLQDASGPEAKVLASQQSQRTCEPAAQGCVHKEQHRSGKTQQSLISVVHIADREPFYTACHSPSCKGLGFCGLCWCSLSIPHLNVKAKDELNIPHLVAMALQADGWFLRQTICWNKNNPMPESVTDRCTKAHEYVFLLTKSARYWYDAEAIRESARHEGKVISLGDKSFSKGQAAGMGVPASGNGAKDQYTVPAGRNKRSVWTVTTTPYKNAHFATFPPKLIEPMILAGCPAKCCPVCGAGWVRVTEKTGEFQRRWSKTNADGSPYGQQGSMQNQYQTIGFQPSCQCNAPDHVPGTVIDPFGGSGTTAYVANAYGRNAILCELNPEYKPLILERLGMPYEVEQEERKPQQQEMF